MYIYIYSRNRPKYKDYVFNSFPPILSRWHAVFVLVGSNDMLEMLRSDWYISRMSLDSVRNRHRVLSTLHFSRLKWHFMLHLYVLMSVLPASYPYSIIPTYFLESFLLWQQESRLSRKCTSVFWSYFLESRSNFNIFTLYILFIKRVITQFSSLTLKMNENGPFQWVLGRNERILKKSIALLREINY